MHILLVILVMVSLPVQAMHHLTAESKEGTVSLLRAYLFSDFKLVQSPSHGFFIQFSRVTDSTGYFQWPISQCETLLHNMKQCLVDDPDLKQYISTSGDRKCKNILFAYLDFLGNKDLPETMNEIVVDHDVFTRIVQKTKFFEDAPLNQEDFLVLKGLEKSIMEHCYKEAAERQLQLVEEKQDELLLARKVFAEKMDVIKENRARLAAAFRTQQIAHLEQAFGKPVQLLQLFPSLQEDQ